MRLPEQRLWDRMRNRKEHNVWLQRVENGVGEGMPDVHSICQGFISWIELKAVAVIPGRATTPLLGEKKGLNVDQRNWHLNWRKHNGTSFILVGVGTGAAAQQFLLDGRLADEINAFTIDDMTDAALAKQWTHIFDHLRGN